MGQFRPDRHTEFPNHRLQALRLLVFRWSLDAINDDYF